MSVPQPKSLRDYPITAYATRPTSEINTGTWKYVEPHYQDRLPPCSHACPAGNDISRIILLLAGGDLIGAGRLLRSGILCPQPSAESVHIFASVNVIATCSAAPSRFT